MKKSQYSPAITLISLALASGTVNASFHLWEIKEAYSNEDGSVQFVELFSSSSGQQFIDDHKLTATAGSNVETIFTFPSNSGSPTTNKHLLLATRDFAIVTGVEPDFIIPAHFLPSDGGSLNFSGVDTLSLTNLPFNGSQSLSGSATVGTPTPVNFNDVSASVPSTSVVFNAESGSLEIAYVGVSGLGTFRASLVIVGSDPLTFDVSEATLMSESVAKDMATVSLETGLLSLPRVEVGDSLYSATLMLDSTASTLRFVLTDAQLLQ